ncbi:histidine kinase [Clostridium sp. AL.422]|uniref:cache domain-containing sensor histidine kinase n=1 Tax=Clostridium TaxID=1485 RepID=UPI00293DEE5A|nr:MULTISPECIES: histidine kinase [unclassified Clostridium]MDV4150337.1 histidine kinase [Clostridium sp. AL.422]
MKNRFYYSQKRFLFIIYSFLVISLMSIFFIYFYSSYKDSIIKDAKVKIESLSTSVKNSLNDQLNNMSTISMNIVYSNAIKKNFTSFSRYYTTDNNSPNFLDLRENVLSLYDIITSIIGTFQSATQVNLYTLNGISIGSGYYQGIDEINLESLSWYKETVAKNGFKHISQIDRLPNSEYSHIEYSKYLTLTRLFFNNSNEPEGIVEVIQDYKIIFGLLSELHQKNPDTSFYIFNEKKELIYPYTSNIDVEVDFIKLLEKNSLSPVSAKFIKADDNNEYLVSYEKLEPYNWTIIISEPKSFVLESLNSFQISFVFIILISLLFTLILCFIISSRITLPLTKLSNETKNITLSNVLSDNEIIIPHTHSNIKEIHELYNSFINMYRKLRESSHEVLLVKSEETRAKLQATQSVVNPHFLYNSLTNISVMAEENMNDDIIKMCNSLCSYFRYLADSSENIVPLFEEILFTEKYIDCMKIRYGDSFIYESSIDEDTKNILIPKLILQPLIENVFKHGFNTSPPWHLRITSCIDNKRWKVIIEDNGGCLSNNKKDELLFKFDNLDKNKELNSLKIGGMGLKSIYIRLKLLYEDECIFYIDNSTEGKTAFIIGGPIYTNKEDFYNDHTQI